MKQKTCLITGANSGIGYETALSLAHLGWKVVLVCRNKERGAQAQEKIISGTKNSDIHLLISDLSSLISVKGLAREFKAKFKELNVIINNAGIYSPKRRTSADGYELTFATNYLGPFLLTELLLDMLKASAPSRIINVASRAHRNGGIDLNDIMLEKSYSGGRAYSSSKLAMILWTYELAKRLEGTGVTVNALCPGGVATHIWRDRPVALQFLINAFLKDSREGAKLPLYLATEEGLEGVTGRYFELQNHLIFQRTNAAGSMTNSSPASYDTVAAKSLLKISEELVNLDLSDKTA